MIRTTLLSRSAMALALTLGTIAGAGLVSSPALAAKKEPKPAAAPKLSLSKPFMAVAAPLQKALEAAKTRPDVVAAKAQADASEAAMRAAQGAAARKAAGDNNSAMLAALGNTLTAERAQLDASFPLIVNQDDRFMAGNLALSLGQLSKDSATLRKGIGAMLESGKVAATEQPKLHFFVGSLAFDAKDYAAARTSLTAAVNGGYHDNDADALLADAYIVDKQVPQGLAMLRQQVEAGRAASKPVGQNVLRRGLSVAYNNKLLSDAGFFSAALAESYPSAINWNAAIAIVRDIGKFPPQESLDLMRLMERTKSFLEERDYIEYIQAADARRSPGEVLKILGLGSAAGKLKANDLFVAEARTIANQRLAADKASLPAFERDARAPSATATTAMAAADAFLSYDDYAKAADLYKIAETKPGADKDRANTRLGIAQLGLGQNADAQAALAKVTGTRQAMAQLWTIYAKSLAAKPAM
jgi:hypothetical protein